MGEPSSVLNRLIAQHQLVLKRFITRRSGPKVLQKTTVDDLFQELVAQAIAHADRVSFVDDAHFLAWMQQILRGIIGKTLRTHGIRQPILRIRNVGSSGPGVATEALFAGQQSPSSLAATHEGTRRLRRAIEDLPSDYRRALSLYKLESRTLDDVAMILQRSKGATSKLIARSLAMLAETLGHP